jgi:anti-sigma regulatory factor (Ser/Thr protein kinase)
VCGRTGFLRGSRGNSEWFSRFTLVAPDPATSTTPSWKWAHAARLPRRFLRDISHGRTVRHQPSKTVTSAGTSAYPVSTPDGQRCEWRLPSVLSSVRGMRRELRGFLDATALSADAIEDLVLAASEAANNAIEHAQQPTKPFFDVCAVVDDGVVTIVIRDHGGWRQPTSPSIRGRGLAMMEALGDTTVTAGSHGTTVTIRSCHAGPGALAENGRAS